MSEQRAAVGAARAASSGEAVWMAVESIDVETRPMCGDNRKGPRVAFPLNSEKRRCGAFATPRANGKLTPARSHSGRFRRRHGVRGAGVGAAR